VSGLCGFGQELFRLISKITKTDILIIGGGLSGLTLAALLGRAGAEVCVVDREDPKAQLGAAFDARTTALSFASRRVLEAAGAWGRIAPHAEPMREIRVADGASPLYLHFSSEEDGGQEAFGWNLENARLRLALLENVRGIKNVRHIAPANVREFFADARGAGVALASGARIEARLLAGADGRDSAVRKWLGIKAPEKDYGQTAIVCNISHALEHDSVAVEHFMPEGPFAVLPLPGKRSSVVWTLPHAAARDVLALPARDFARRLAAMCGGQLGAVKVISTPRGYPLRLMHAERYTGPRTALLAEAAHVVHPIAGQGLNLSLRDAALLAELASARLSVGLDPGSSAMLAEYEAARRADTRLMAGFTHGINALFSNDLATVGLARGLGLGLVQRAPMLKRFFARQAMGLGGNPSRIVRTGRVF
jgi:2-octaprenyl-6-methoxyphenol hydroxylase